MLGELTLTESDVFRFIGVGKIVVGNEVFAFPIVGGKLEIKLHAPSLKEDFLLDLNRTSCVLSKVTYQMRVWRVVILVRVDLGGSPHRNPDGEDILCPHIHIYRPGYGTKWAYPLDPSLTGFPGPPLTVFTRSNDLGGTMRDFATYCSIETPFSLAVNLNLFDQ